MILHKENKFFKSSSNFLYLNILLHFKHFVLFFIHSPHKIQLQSEQFIGSKGNLLQLAQSNLGKFPFSLSSKTITLSDSTLPILNLTLFLETKLLLDFLDVFDLLDIDDLVSRFRSSSLLYLFV